MLQLLSVFCGVLGGFRNHIVESLLCILSHLNDLMMFKVVPDGMEFVFAVREVWRVCNGAKGCGQRRIKMSVGSFRLSLGSILAPSKEHRKQLGSSFPDLTRRDCCMGHGEANVKRYHCFKPRSRAPAQKFAWEIDVCLTCQTSLQDDLYEASLWIAKYPWYKTHPPEGRLHVYIIYTYMLFFMDKCKVWKVYA